VGLTAFRHHDVFRAVGSIIKPQVVQATTSDGIDSSTAARRMMIGVLGSLAEYECDLVKERSALKREASQADGTGFGRPK
jgi:DNA invertase Pin-like site-specific DNA recombinase